MIYTIGTIAGNASTITGTGTNFTAAGSLIRAGCTLITFTNPVQVLQLTAVTSATALSVTPAISPAIAAGTKYAILLSDSLSVDGLAQDIAETFGMYQKYIGGFSDVMNGTSDVTITIDGKPVTVPGQKSLAKKGENSDITSLSGLTTALSVAQGGTGGKTATDALNNLSAYSKAQVDSLTDIAKTNWILLAALNGWYTMSGWRSAYKKVGNVVYLDVSMQAAGSASVADKTVIGQLPVGYRPQFLQRYAVVGDTATTGKQPYIVLNTDGTLTLGNAVAGMAITFSIVFQGYQ
jgi:hypothetical protein